MGIKKGDSITVRGIPGVHIVDSEHNGPGLRFIHGDTGAPFTVESSEVTVLRSSRKYGGNNGRITARYGESGIELAPGVGSASTIKANASKRPEKPEEINVRVNRLAGTEDGFTITFIDSDGTEVSVNQQRGAFDFRTWTTYTNGTWKFSDGVKAERISSSTTFYTHTHEITVGNKELHEAVKRAF